MAKLVQQYIDIAKKRNPGEEEFIQTIEEVLTSLVLSDEERERKMKLSDMRS